MTAAPPWSELIALGKRKGYVTYDDVHRAMPSDVVAVEQINEWLAALSEHSIELRDDPEPMRPYGDDRVRSAHRTGRAIGPLFVQNLIDLAAGETPMSYPCGGVYCRAGETAYRAVHFPDGLTSDLYLWLAQPTLEDAALLAFLGHAHEVSLMLGSCDGTGSSDLTCQFKVSVRDGRAATSLPGRDLKRVGPDVFDAFVAGLRAGIAEQPRAGELGFGELGDYTR